MNFRKDPCWKHCKYKEWVSCFSGFMGNGSERGTNKSSENRFAVHMICLSRAPIHSPWTQKKRHSFLNCSSTFTAFNQRFKKWRHGTKWRHMWRHITQMESQRQILCSVENQKLRFYHTDHSPPKKLLSTKDKQLYVVCTYENSFWEANGL